MKKTDRVLTSNRVRELLTYSPESGGFVWAATRGRAIVGMAAGFVAGSGYSSIRLDGINYQSHRLVWLHVHGVWPSGFIDHINGDRSDNRLCNLRDVNRAENMQNQRRAHRSNRSGCLGVAQTKWGKFQASISAHGTKKNLGNFNTVEEASVAYQAAKRALHIGSAS